MEKLYSASDIAKLIGGIHPITIKNWEKNGWIGGSFRIGLQQKRVWSRDSVLAILQWARDKGGYPIVDRVFDQVRSA